MHGVLRALHLDQNWIELTVGNEHLRITSVPKKLPTCSDRWSTSPWSYTCPLPGRSESSWTSNPTASPRAPPARVRNPGKVRRPRPRKVACPPPCGSRAGVGGVQSATRWNGRQSSATVAASGSHRRRPTSAPAPIAPASPGPCPEAPPRAATAGGGRSGEGDSE